MHQPTGVNPPPPTTTTPPPLNIHEAKTWVWKHAQTKPTCLHIKLWNLKWTAFVPGGWWRWSDHAAAPRQSWADFLKNVFVKRSSPRYRIIWHKRWAFSYRPKLWIMSAAETLCELRSRLCNTGTNASKNIAPPLKTWQKNIGWCYWTILQFEILCLC